MLKERKEEIIKAYATHEGDTGSPEVQIALLTERSFLNYLMKNDIERYRAVVEKLGLRH